MGQHYGKSLGEIAYDAYSADAGGKTHDKKNIPPWDKLGDDVRAHWQAGGQAAADAIINNRTAQFPDHNVPPPLPRV